MTTRRELIAALARVVLAATVTAPSVSLAQRTQRAWRVGFLAARARPASIEADDYGQVLVGLRELGWVEGRDIVVDWRFADGSYERLPDLALELASIPVDVLVTAEGTPPALAAQKATKTIPIVFIGPSDPVASGLVASLPRPGRNLTGMALLADDTFVKEMEMLLALAPGGDRLAVLWDPANPQNHVGLKRVQEAAETRRMKLLPLAARTPSEIDAAFAVMRREAPAALLVSPDPFFLQQRGQIAERAAALRLPSIGSHRDYAAAGGLLSYGANRREIYLRAAAFVDKLLKGARAADLPVEQPTKFELVINQKTAKALGLEIPAELLVQADRVIE